VQRRDWLAVQAAGGGYHSIALTHTGSVYTWGCGDGGRLGLGEEDGMAVHGDETLAVYSNVYVPRRVALPAGVQACAVAAGGDFSLLLSEAGEVFGFGLMQPVARAGDEQRWADVSRPTPLQCGLRGWRVAQIAAGYDHALAMGTDGQVISWGAPGRLPEATPASQVVGQGAGSFELVPSGQLAHANEPRSYMVDLVVGRAERLGVCDAVAAGGRISAALRLDGGLRLAASYPGNQAILGMTNWPFYLAEHNGWDLIDGAEPLGLEQAVAQLHD
jgi:alpha-tubulin suppressor-like RCC1 family protein